VSGVLALALQRLALSHGTVPSAVPVGHPANGGTNGTVWTNGTTGTDETASERGSSDDRERRCFVCGQPARFGFGVRIRQGEEGRWFCAAHRPQEAGTA
jgi:hypothetical protein